MRALVWNDNPHTDWKETFKGEMVTIPKGKSVEMEFFEAHEFKGQYSPIRKKNDETQDPASFKMIRVEKVADGADEDDEIEAHQCNLCKKVYATESSLIKHSDASHSDRTVTDPEGEKLVIKKQRGRQPKEKHAE